MTIHIDPTLPEPHIVTRDGHPVMIFAYFKRQQKSFIGAFYTKETWVACSWNKDGTYIGPEQANDMDIVIVRDMLRIK